MISGPQSIQNDFTLHAWRSPDQSFHHVFALLNLGCALDNLPGIAIVTNQSRSQATATSVVNLRQELPALLRRVPSPLLYWFHEPAAFQRAQSLARLTSRPVYYG